MSEASDQQMSHADRHDLDKLARWKDGLDIAADVEATRPSRLCAIFLVSPDDRLPPTTSSVATAPCSRNWEAGSTIW